MEKDDDFKTPKGNLADDVRQFGISWADDDQECKYKKLGDAPCQPSSNNKCNELLDINLFGQVSIHNANL